MTRTIRILLFVLALAPFAAMAQQAPPVDNPPGDTSTRAQPSTNNPRTDQPASGTDPSYQGMNKDPNSDQGTAATAGGGLTTEAILDQIHIIDQSEIDLANVANTQSDNSAVKKVASSIKRDTNKSEQDLASLAKKRSVTLADEKSAPLPSDIMASNKLATEDQAKVKALSGAAFDKSFASTLVQRHQDTLNFLDRARSATTDSDVQAFIDKVRPTVAQHQKMAEDLVNKLSSSPSAM
jgi:putative membrane protein